MAKLFKIKLSVNFPFVHPSPTLRPAKAAAEQRQHGKHWKYFRNFSPPRSLYASNFWTFLFLWNSIAVLSEWKMTLGGKIKLCDEKFRFILLMDCQEFVFAFVFVYPLMRVLSDSLNKWLNDVARWNSSFSRAATLEWASSHRSRGWLLKPPRRDWKHAESRARVKRVNYKSRAAAQKAFSITRNLIEFYDVARARLRCRGSAPLEEASALDFSVNYRVIICVPPKGGNRDNCQKVDKKCLILEIAAWRVSRRTR